MTPRATTVRTRRAGAACHHARSGRSPMSDRAPVPVWVHRMHADGLPTTEAPSRAPLQTGSQRFVERWDRVARGY